MWKKLAVMGIALLGTFSVVYAFQSDLSATSTTYNAGGAVTGRINKAPAGLTNSDFGLRKGDKVLIGTKNPLDNKDLGWQLLYFDNQYPIFDVLATGENASVSATSVDTGKKASAWYVMSNKEIYKGRSYDSTPSTYTVPGVATGTSYINNVYTLNNHIVKAREFSDINYAKMKMKNLIAPADYRIIDYGLKFNGFTDPGVIAMRHTIPISIKIIQNEKFFIPEARAMLNRTERGNVKVPDELKWGFEEKDCIFSEKYYTNFSDSNYLGLTVVAFNAKGTIEFSQYNDTILTRLATMLDLSDVVFALQSSTNTGFATPTAQNLPSAYSSIYDASNNFKEMKLRIADPAVPINVELVDLVNTLGNTVSSIEKDGKLYIKAKADSGYTVSVALFDKATNAFKYYKPLEASKGMTNNLYELDLTGVAAGSYKIAIVNEEFDESTTAPAYSSLFSDTKDLTILNQADMSGLKADLVKTGGTDLTDVFKTTDKGNTKKGDPIANLSVTNGIGNPAKISYNLIKDTKVSDDSSSFKVKVGTDNYPVLNSGKVQMLVEDSASAKDFLTPDVYTLRVQAYDEYGNPYPAVDQTGAEIKDSTKLANTKKVKESPFYNTTFENTITKDNAHGIISDDVTVVVYPHESQITYAQLKDSNDEFYKKDVVNGSTFTNHLGTLTFATEANMQKLFDEGYFINTTSSKLMKKGSTTEQITALKITADTSNKSQFYIDKNSNVESGTYNFDAWLYFKNSKGDTALLKLTDQSLYIAPSLKYVNPDKNTELLTGDTYSRKYNAYASSDNKENIFTLVSTDKSDLTSNSDVKYCIYDETAKTCALSNDSDVLTLVDNGNGTATITAKTYQKDDPNVVIRSYIKDDKGTILTYEDVTIQINRSERKMKWEGTGISSLNSTVSAKDDGTFELKLPYDSATSIDYAYSKILKDDAAPTSGTLALRHDDGTGAISNTMSGNMAAGATNDSFKLSGKCTGTSCYIEIAKAQDDIFEAGTAKLYIVTEDLAAIEDAKISWSYQDASTWKVASNPLAVNYKEDGIVPVKIDTTKLPADIKNVSIVYTLEDTKKVDTITVANKSGSTLEAEMKILQANQTTDNASIKAVISSDNYAQKTVTLPVRINKLTQTIDFNTAFKDLATSIKVDTSANYDYSAVLKVDASTAGKGTISYTVAGTPSDMLTNNSTNKSYNVTKSGSVVVTATLTDDKNYTSTTKSVTKTITYYSDAGLTWKQSTPNPEAVNTINGGTTGDADVNKEVGDIAIDGGKSAAYNFTVENTKHGDDSTYFSVMLNSDKKSGKLKIIKKIDATALNTHATQVGKGDTYEWTIKVKATSTTDSSEVAESEIKITFVGAQPDITFTKADSNKKITDTYESAKNLDLSVKRGGISASDPTITISGYSSALSLNVDGISALIKAANTDNNDAVRTGRKVEVKAQVPASGGYKTGDSPLNEVIIKKAEHPTIDFDSKVLSSSNNVDVGITGILNGSGKSNEAVTITPIKGADSDPWVIDTFTISKGEAYTTPSLSMSPKGYLGTIDFTITATGDDNYKPLPADTKTTVEFTEAGGIIYKPIVVTYGDKSKTVLEFIVTPNPSDDPDTVSYTYTGYDDTIVSIDADGKIIPLKVGETTLTFKRMDSADSSEMEQNIKVTVKQKDITIYVNSLNKKVGEVMKASDFTIDTSKSTAFEDGDDVGVLTFSCQDSNVEVITLPNGLTGPAPKALPINVTYVGGIDAQKANYKITYKPGTLNVSQDTGLDSWVSVVPKGSTTFKDNWYNGDVDIKINAISGSYSEISPDGNAPWASSFTIIEEGKITQDVAFRDPTTLAKATSIKKEILIDHHAPRVEKITAKSSNNKLEDILNALTFGTLFQPGTQFTIATSDKVSGVNQVSGTTSLTYSIYRIEKDNSETELEKDKTVSIKDEAIGVKISDSSGTYKVCTTATDLAGNKGTESCAKVVIGYKGMDETTGDNECPDLNLDFNDDGTAELNIDLDGDKIPDMNIDSDFDGEADINVDSDEDGKPDLNLVMLDSWEPGMCSVVNGKNYATMEGIKPEINVVIDNGTDEIKDQKPYLNIDTSGDMKADFNISFDGKEPYLNIGKVPEQWIPETDYDFQGFMYDTMKDLEPLLNMGIIDDKYPSINVDTDKDGKADINIDTNGDGIPDVNIDGDGDGVKDINIDTDNNGTPDEKIVVIKTWKPDTLVNGKVPYKTQKIEYVEEGDNTLTDNGVTIEKPGGIFLPNFALRVSDVTTNLKETIKMNIPKEYKDKDVTTVYNVEMLKDDTLTQPDGKMIVKIPAKAGLRNPLLMVEGKDGSYTTITPKEENGYYVYETDYLGIVSVLGDVEGKDDVDDPIVEDPTTKPKDPSINDPNASDNTGGTNKPSTSVKGTYVNGIGGASTGDETEVSPYMMGMLSTIGILFFLKKKSQKEE